MKKLWPALLLAIAVIVAHPEAEAKRLGGGKSVGQQSSNVTQREATPGAPTQNFNQAAPRPANAAPAAPAATPKKPWGAMLGGLAAGLGLAWLAHSLGFGEGLAQFLLFALLGIAVLAVVALVLRKRQATNTASASPFAFQGQGLVHPPMHRCCATIAPIKWVTMPRPALGSATACRSKTAALPLVAP